MELLSPRLEILAKKHLHILLLKKKKKSVSHAYKLLIEINAQAYGNVL